MTKQDVAGCEALVEEVDAEELNDSLAAPYEGIEFLAFAKGVEHGVVQGYSGACRTKRGECEPLLQAMKVVADKIESTSKHELDLDALVATLDEAMDSFEEV